MQDLVTSLIIGLCVWANYRRAKIKSARIITGLLLALFLNIFGVGIFYFKTRTRSPKPQVNSMTSEKQFFNFDLGVRKVSLKGWASKVSFEH